MFEYISGKLSEVAPTYAVVDVAGVGYYINISLETFSKIESESQTKLYTHYVVREDAQLLYGFAERVERELFRMLIGVSGVGGNTARMILSTYSPTELRSIIASENAVLLKNVKGLGLKTAQKIIVDMQGKMAGIDTSGDITVVAVDTGVVAEATSALVMLGFAKAASEKVLSAIVKESPEITVEELIRVALKRL